MRIQNLKSVTNMSFIVYKPIKGFLYTNYRNLASLKLMYYKLTRIEPTRVNKV